MTWRAAQDVDLDWIQSFLMDNLQSSMFLLSNLRDYGLHDRTADKGMTFWVSQEPVPGVFAISNSGMILLQSPEADPSIWRAAHGLVANRKALIGCLGETQQVRSFLRAVELENLPALLDEDEPAFRLDLADLVLPDLGGAELLPLSDLPRELAVTWRQSYHHEVLGSSFAEAGPKAEADITSYIEKDSHRALIVQGQPVAITGFNATLPSVVQIGGVYTPPEMRGRGYARLALALHLIEARAKGVTESVLFASGPAAVRAYMSLGYQRAGEFTLVLFDTSRKDLT